MAVMAVWAAVLITYGVSTGIAMPKNDVLPLDMAPDSVDDMYTDCKDKMRSKVQTEYLQNEKNQDSDFKQAWDKAEEYLKKRSPIIGKERAAAIYVYTLDKPKIYPYFNDAVRTQKSEYKTTFRYHALHFYLTDALQTLSARKSEAERCLTGYRGVERSFSQNVLNTEIRFGSFTSSTRFGYKIAKKFGDKSCFEIFTCFGADISLHSAVGENEGEVLIPPYEVFKVIEIKKRSDQKSLPCEVVYKLKSTRTLSNLNCALVLHAVNKTCKIKFRSFYDLLISFVLPIYITKHQGS